MSNAESIGNMPEDSGQEPSAYDTVRADLERDALEHGLTIHQELQRRLDEKGEGAVVATGHPPTRLQRFGRRLIRGFKND